MSNSKKQKNKCSGDYDYIDRFSKWFEGLYSPASLLTIVLLMCLVLVVLGRLDRRLDAQTLQLKRKPSVYIVDCSGKWKFAELKNNQDKAQDDNSVLLLVPTQTDSGNVDCKDE